MNDRKVTYHVVKMSLQVLRKVMQTCLMNAQKSDLRSIAFPAIGTGNLGVPREVASRIMYDEVQIFSQDYDNSIVNDVRFVIFDKDYLSIRVRNFY